MAVSTHAPARRTTRFAARAFALGLVSIHAPARRATQPRISRIRHKPGFDPRPPHGGDLQRRQFHLRHAVSIHAPARGATLCPSKTDRCAGGFDPRPRTGATLNRLRLQPQVLVSIDATAERPHHGACRSFDPRPPRGATMLHNQSVVAFVVSKSTPRRRATGLIALGFLLGLVSIHALARGATRISGCGRQCTSCFDPRPARGRHSGWPHSFRAWWFQSTPPHGGRPTRCCTSSKRRSFNPRPRTGGDGPEDNSNPQLAKPWC